MARKPVPFAAHRTAWHPLFVRALVRTFPARYFRVLGEYQLNWQPMRLDSVIVKKRSPPPGFDPGALRPIYDHLGETTLIELKGATVSLDWRDLIVFLAAADLYCASEGIRDPRRLCLMMVASRITPRFKKRIRLRDGAPEESAISAVQQGTQPGHIIRRQALESVFCRLFH